MTTTQSIRSTNKFPSHMSEDDTSPSLCALLNPEELSSSSQQHEQSNHHHSHHHHHHHNNNNNNNNNNKHQRQSLRIKSHEAPAKPKRKRISQEQFQALSELFEQTDTPNYELREKLALKLNMTNREVQVWFQNRRAKFNRVRVQEQRNQQLLLQKQQQQHQPIPRWPEVDPQQQHPVLIYNNTSSTSTSPTCSTFPHHQQDASSFYATNNKRRYNNDQELPAPNLSYHEDSFSSTSSSSSSTPTSPYPTLSPDMAPLEILAMAADYVQRCDQEQEEAEQAAAAKKRRRTNNTTMEEEAHPQQEQQHQHTQKSWRPWL
ncbi:homeobox domain-containing protein [Phascolomyces articulosus]|uniref:Homeobox domain-containing protein n=1 Tax=Phascolomyces articulosus TaxID=60185 RepID=A0AAD5KAJ3_9FUNG|nr:homeobox domain-containing protein [Phascolomyces articulosus]